MGNAEVRAVLELLEERMERLIYEFQTRDKINEMEKRAKKHFQAREYAFYCQQYFNVKYTLKILEMQKEALNSSESIMSYSDICNDIKSFE